MVRINEAKKDVTVVYEIGSTVKNGVDFIGDFYVFKPRELKFLEEFAKDYALQIAYFEENFYKGSTGYSNMKRYLQLASSTLDIVFTLDDEKRK